MENKDIEIPVTQTMLVKQLLMRDLIEKRINQYTGFEVTLYRELATLPIISFSTALENFNGALTPSTSSNDDQAQNTAMMNDEFITLTMRIAFVVDKKTLQDELLDVLGVFDANNRLFDVSGIDVKNMTFQQMILMVFRIYSQEIQMSVETAVPTPRPKSKRGAAK